MFQSLRIFLSDRNGATNIEYALIAVLLSLAIIVGARAVGTKLSTAYFQPISSNL